MSHRRAKKVRSFLKDKGVDWKDPKYKSLYKALKRVFFRKKNLERSA